MGVLGRTQYVRIDTYVLRPNSTTHAIYYVLTL
jgi:hypothetical protein